MQRREDHALYKKQTKNNLLCSLRSSVSLCQKIPLKPQLRVCLQEVGGDGGEF